MKLTEVIGNKKYRSHPAYIKRIKAVKPETYWRHKGRDNEIVKILTLKDNKKDPDNKIVVFQQDGSKIDSPIWNVELFLMNYKPE